MILCESAARYSINPGDAFKVIDPFFWGLRAASNPRIQDFLVTLAIEVVAMGIQVKSHSAKVLSGSSE